MNGPKRFIQELICLFVFLFVSFILDLKTEEFHFAKSITTIEIIEIKHVKLRKILNLK
jgi:hypothetical protein